MSQLVVQLNSSTAAEVHAGQPKSIAAKAFARAVKAAGGTVDPMHPGVSDPAMVSYFTVNIPSGEGTAALVEELLRLPCVEAAYAKPDDALPGG